MSKNYVYNPRNFLAGRTYKTRLRQSAITMLGGKCYRCNFDDIRALQIDHVGGGGNKLRKQSGYYVSMYKDIINGNFDGLQLLCANCNWIKRYENNEMHTKPIEPELLLTKRYYKLITDKEIMNTRLKEMEETRKRMKEIVAQVKEDFRKIIR